MSASSPPPDDDLPRDPAFDEAWRALSAEEPPAAIDAALRAAARREVDAGPRIAVADRIAAPRAAKPMNWWRPLAVAATLGALAVGLVQLIAPERVGAPGRDAAVVSDMPATEAARPAETAKKQAAEATSGEVGAIDEKTRVPQASAVPAPQATDRKNAQPPAPESASAGRGGARKELQSSDAGSPFRQAAPADELARKDAAAERKRDMAAGAPPTSPTSTTPKLEAPANVPAKVAPAPALERPPASPEAPPTAVAPLRAAEPFPAERASRGDASATREAATEESSAHPPAAAGVISPPPSEAGADKFSAQKPITDNRAAPLAKLKTAPTQDATGRAASASDLAQRRSEQDAQSAADGAPTPAASPLGGTETRAAAHPGLAVPDWIVLIRRLIAEKNFAMADRELAAFRSAHADAQQLLPTDLRNWKPPR